MINLPRSRTCCFTGHRPEKLNIPPSAAKERLNTAIKQAINDGFTVFISGMARGTDMWAAEIVLEKKKQNENIALICAVPHPDFEKRWSKENQRLYNSILSRADEVYTVNDTFSMGAYMKRNKWMVDRSSLVLAFFNGSPGGTRNTIEYARDSGVKTVTL